MLTGMWSFMENFSRLVGAKKGSELKDLIFHYFSCCQHMSLSSYSLKNDTLL